MEAAINIAIDCMAVGTKWWKRDSRARNCKFWYFVDGYDESFSIEYEEQKKWQKAIMDQPAEAAADSAKAALSSGKKRKAPEAPTEESARKVAKGKATVPKK